MQVKLQGLFVALVCISTLFVCKSSCVFRQLGGASWARTALQQQCWEVRERSKGVYLHFDALGVWNPLTRPRCLLHLCHAHNDKHKPRTLPTLAPPRTDKVWIISSLVMVRLDECSNICMMMNCTAARGQPCSVGPQNHSPGRRVS